ncbi:uncharacterized protein LOC120106639 [Phoenix dactylifera]|uniref:Uncharacterized protein LOC120106639 n=1 Tax=Phoenix dactylifera TaxID=42345 RepID=A0A8B8ZW11_PHODC|nr:uncharacterized protein LOC120106639 [Phoenix dactylifera]
MCRIVVFVRSGVISLEMVPSIIRKGISQQPPPPYFQPLQEGMCSVLTGHEMYQPPLEEEQMGGGGIPGLKNWVTRSFGAGNNGLGEEGVWDLVVLLVQWGMGTCRDPSIHLAREHLSIEVSQGIGGLVGMKPICGTIVARRKAKQGKEDKFTWVSPRSLYLPLLSILIFFSSLGYSCCLQDMKNFTHCKSL